MVFTGEIVNRDSDAYLYFDGRRLRLVAFQQGNAVYWVTNTLLRTLTNREMMGIATSLTRYGGH